MDRVTHLLMEFSAGAAGSLAAAIWEGVVLAVCVALVLRLIPGITAAVRSMIWSAVLVLVVGLHFGSALGWNAGAVGAQGPVVYVDPRWSVAAVCVWAMLSLFRGVQLVRSAVYLRGVARRSTAVDARLAWDWLLTNGRRRVQLCVSADVDRPSVVGFFSPRILLPTGLMERLSDGELQQVLLHEMEHLRRGDDWMNLLQKVALVLFPLNPVLFWVDRRLCVERELACDDGVMHTTGARKAYALCLTNLAEQSVLRRGVSLALGAWERQSELARRVHRILRKPEAVMGRGPAMAVTAAMVFGVLGGAFELARSPQVVSFADQGSGFRAQGPDDRVQGAGSSAQSSVRADVLNADMRVGTPVRKNDASAVMVKAVMPKARVQGSGFRGQSTPVGVRQKRVASTAPRQRARVVQQMQSWVVMTEWRSSVAPAEVVPVSFEAPQHSYAAVPIGDGWLILQL